jgi:hypothetical protein
MNKDVRSVGASSWWLVRKTSDYCTRRTTFAQIWLEVLQHLAFRSFMVDCLPYGIITGRSRIYHPFGGLSLGVNGQKARSYLQGEWALCLEVTCVRFCLNISVSLQIELNTLTDLIGPSAKQTSTTL